MTPTYDVGVGQNLDNSRAMGWQEVGVSLADVEFSFCRQFHLAV